MTLAWSIIWSFLRANWKWIVPAIIVLYVLIVIRIQRAQISDLRGERDVAIVEHDRAMEEQKQLLSDIDRINAIIVRQRATERELEEKYNAAKKRIQKLSSTRPDVASWSATPLPVGLWDAAIDSGASDGNPPGIDRTHTDP